MNRSISQLAIATSGVVFALAVVDISPTRAASLWSFDFQGDFGGGGTIELDLGQSNSNGNGFLVTALDFELDFGGGILQAIVLEDFTELFGFPVQDIFFDPTNPAAELTNESVGLVAPGWSGFTALGASISLDGNSGPAAPTLGGTIVFGDLTGSSSSTWTAAKIPEPLTILGSLLAVGMGCGLKKRRSAKTN
ncbi:PEP-CTERM sorting domain-containing protein [Synechococcus sp. PCC 7336]|uniref:PEP-CTERM sorting domain-containing protein n=1 Tax=Synechococcus sp. PCC 7336 TaxID=195250 RepID=UPI00034DCC0A|nr:PEP-CTERM sorting domain-containing protein [Synechococcus sp. PCC 7336]